MELMSSSAASPVITQLIRKDLHPDVCLLFEVVGHPSPSIHWFKDGLPVILGDDDTGDYCRIPSFLPRLVLPQVVTVMMMVVMVVMMVIMMIIGSSDLIVVEI